MTAGRKFYAPPMPQSPAAPTVRVVPLEPLLVTVPEAAKALAMGERKVWDLVRKGTLPSVKQGGQRRIAVDALRAYVARLHDERNLY